MANSHNLVNTNTTIKFLCSYGGRILPRYPDGKLRYHGGETRVLSVDASVSFSELLGKMGEMCGSLQVSLRCQLPAEDLDALVSIKSDEDLANLVEEYDRVGDASAPAPIKIRAFLSVPKAKVKKVPSPPPSAASPPKPAAYSGCSPRPNFTNRASRAPPAHGRSAGKVVGRSRCYHHRQHEGGYVYWVHHGRYWQ